MPAEFEAPDYRLASDSELIDAAAQSSLGAGTSTTDRDGNPRVVPGGNPSAGPGTGGNPGPGTPGTGTPSTGSRPTSPPHTATAMRRHRRVTVGSLTAGLAAGHKAALTLALDRTGRALLASTGRLAVTVKVTVRNGARTLTVETAHVTLTSRP